MTALLGTLSVLMLCRIGRRLFRSTFLGCLAGALLAVDGLHFVMSRTALLDLVLMFFVVAAFGCLLIDRDRSGPAGRCPAGRPTRADCAPTTRSLDPAPGLAALADHGGRAAGSGLRRPSGTASISWSPSP